MIYFKESSLGFVKNSAWKIVGPELTKVGLTPILNMYLGIEDEGPSNQDVMDKIDKSTAEIKAEIAKVLDAAMELSTQTANYHQLQMNQLQAISSNIDTKDFRTQADTVAADLNEHSYIKTPDYNGGIDAINNEIKVMEEQAIMDFAIINVLNSMQYKVKEYEIDNGIITINEDESAFARYENTATNLQNSLREMNDAPYSASLQSFLHIVVNLDKRYVPLSTLIIRKLMVNSLNTHARPICFQYNCTMKV